LDVFFWCLSLAHRLDSLGDLIKCWGDVGAKKKITAEHAAAINALEQIRNLSNESEENNQITK